MNKKGQASYYFMLIITMFILGMALAYPLNQSIQTHVRDGQNVTLSNGTVIETVNLDCSNEAISNDYKSLCAETDIISPVFLGIIMGFIGILVGRMAGW